MSLLSQRESLQGCAQDFPVTLLHPSHFYNSPSFFSLYLSSSSFPFNFQAIAGLSGLDILALGSGVDRIRIGLMGWYLVSMETISNDLSYLNRV